MAASPGFASAAPTLINFDPPGSPTVTTTPLLVTTLYGPLGVLFPAAFLDKDANAHSPPQVLRSNTFAAEFPTEPLVINFLSPQKLVSFWAGSHLVAANGTLTGFDASNNVVATDGPRAVAADLFTTQFQIQVNAPTIVSVQFQLDQMVVKSIDDLQFEGQPPPPPPTTAPVVTITSPANGALLDVDTVAITGTVTGAGLVPPVAIDIEFLQPSGTNHAPGSVPFTGSAITAHVVSAVTTQQFSDTLSPVPLGPITVTATAVNTANLTGSATITFTNLPVPIRNRFTAEGGAAVVGNFRYGLLRENCKIAVYEHAAISVDASGTTRIIRIPILTKWIAVQLGCPLGEEGFGAAGTRMQDFEGGRIYTDLPTGGTAYVPNVFLDAINKRGGDAVMGVPFADPTHATGPDLTSLFQQFARLGQTELPSTLEIRGFPPTLYMERQLGPWFDDRLVLTPTDIALHRSAATLWESFPCDKPSGPCTVGDELPFPPPNNPGVGETYCGGNTYFPGEEPPPEWQAIKGDYIDTFVFGAIVSAHMADIDNGLTHETHNGNCPYLGAGLAIGSAIVGFPIAFGAYVAATEYGIDCVSDYEFFVRPIGPQGDSFPLPSLLGKSNVDEIKTEYEVAYAADAHNFLGAPTTGDVVHMTGRWIVDCGHDSFKTELHPLFSFATMKTVISETDPFTGLENIIFEGKQGTRVAIWVNGWYPGGDGNAIEFDIFPPPRPTPDSQLIVFKPLDFGPNAFAAAVDVTLEYALLPATAANHVHLRFTSALRQNTVTSAGEMKFQSGRQYWGKWYLFWAPP